MTNTRQAIVEFLQQPSAYADCTSKVESVETHISWIFLTEQFAYKLKKPVVFDFLDFHTPQLRREACEAEVRLNRRLAPECYLGVVPITQSNGRLEIEGKGRPIDWLVKMKRLPADRSLDRLIAERKVVVPDLERLARKFTQFYLDALPLSLSPEQYREDFASHIRSNQRDLESLGVGLDPAQIQRIHQSQLRTLQLAADQFKVRVEAGRIIDGHGDLRPEHVFLLPDPVVIDCIEFNADYRRIDIWDELCFFASECDVLDASWIGDHVMDAYRRASGDAPSKLLTDFYRSYRLCVRAKIESWQAQQGDEEHRQRLRNLVQRRLHLADAAARRLGPLLLIVIRGLTGTGKSTLASQLAMTLAVDHLQTDAFRKELFGATSQPTEYDQKIYRPENRLLVYDHLFAAASQRLDAGVSVILDGTFLTSDLRRNAVELARRHGAAAFVFTCHCPDEVARQRITKRTLAANSISESHPEIHRRQRIDVESDSPETLWSQIDSTLEMSEQVREVVRQLQSFETNTPTSANLGES